MQKHKWNWFLLGALAACFGGAATARADLLLTAQSVSAQPGSVNDTFNVYLTNTGASAVDVEAFSFEIDTTDPVITFEQSSTATTLYPYVFAGNSFVETFLGTNVNSTVPPPPGQTLDASDLTATAGTFTVVNPGQSFGLGLIDFDVAAAVPSQVAPVNFNTNIAFTSVSDQFGNLFPLTFANGSIGISTVPEPSGRWPLALGLAALVWMLKRSRRPAWR
jgi:hypothetical protein